MDLAGTPRKRKCEFPAGTEEKRLAVEEVSLLLALPAEVIAEILLWACGRDFLSALQLRLVCRWFRDVVGQHVIKHLCAEVRIIAENDRMVPCMEARKLKSLFPDLRFSGNATNLRGWCMNSGSNLTMFEKVWIDCMGWLTSLSVTPGLLKEIRAGGCWHLQDTSSFLGVKKVALFSCGKLEDLSGLALAESVYLSNAFHISDISHLSNAKTVMLDSCSRVTNLSPLRYAEKVTLVCTGIRLVDLSPLGSVREVCIESSRISDVSALKGVWKLRLREMHNVSSVAGLSGVKHLQLDKMNNLRSLKGLEGVQSLLVRKCSIRRLPNFHNAKYVKVDQCENMIRLCGKHGTCTIKTLWLDSCKIRYDLIPLSFDAGYENTLSGYAVMHISTLIVQSCCSYKEYVHCIDNVPRIIWNNHYVSPKHDTYKVHHHFVKTTMTVDTDGEIYQYDKQTPQTPFPLNYCEECSSEHTMLINTAYF